MASEMILQNNTTIFNEGQSVRLIGIIKSGSVIMKHKYFSLTLEAGEVMGLLHLHNGLSFTTDITLEDTTISAYRLENTFPDKSLLQSDSELQEAALNTLARQFKNMTQLFMQCREQLKSTYLLHNDLVQKYTVLCEKLHVTSKIPMSQPNAQITKLVNSCPYTVSYYKDLNLILDKYSDTFLKEHPSYVYGLLLKASKDAKSLALYIEDLTNEIINLKNLFFNEDYNDYFRYFSELISKTHPGSDDFEDAKNLLTALYSGLTQLPFVDKEVLETRMDDQKKKLQDSPRPSATPSKATVDNLSIQDILSNSMHKILSVADEDEEFISTFTKQILAYKEFKDRSASLQNIAQLRRQLTESYLRLYTNLALKFVTGKDKSDLVKLFLVFGYIDEDLAGKENAETLYKLLKADMTDESEQVYTFIDWLQAIYDGKKEPSRNEFDMDYTDFLRSERATGKITAAEEKLMLDNTVEKVKYELKNFFPQANKMTFGHISTYCPFFSDHNLIDSLGKGLLSTVKLLTERENIRQIDYQIFYKDVVYTNPSVGINAEFIHKEIYPDIILMPNYGARGIMWQEVEGKKRATPCRMVLPIFTPENIRMLFLRICGEYRWEMCKRTQGSHWNDPSSNSLTADYFDYLQFYRKNNDLTAETKEKVKVLLTKARNSIKEAFVLDYIVYVLYESGGSPRLNKVSRGILFNHCPFSAELRKKLVSNPIYLSNIQRHNSKYEQLSHRMNNLCQKITNAGKTPPDELLQEAAFFDK